MWPHLDFVCNFGHLSVGSTSNYLCVSRGGWPRWWKTSRARLKRNDWGLLVCSGWRIEGWGVTSPQSTTSSRGPTGEGRGVGLLSLMTSYGMWGTGMKLSQGKLRLNTGKRVFTERVVGPWNPRKWSWHQAWQSSRSIWMMLSVIWFSFRLSCEE